LALGYPAIGYRLFRTEPKASSGLVAVSVPLRMFKVISFR
jgi:hypothetical protein